MESIKQIPSPRREDIIESLESVLEMAKRGEVLDVVIVASIKDEDGPGFYRCASFDDRWRILGALEYAKQGFNDS